MVYDVENYILKKGTIIVTQYSDCCVHANIRGHTDYFEPLTEEFSVTCTMSIRMD